MNKINCLYLLHTVQYLLNLLVSINCVTCSILASTGAAAGLGGWGYTAHILTLTGVVALMQLFALKYPNLCKKERKCDVMQLSSV